MYSSVLLAVLKLVYIPQILLQEREWEPSALSLHQSGGLSREGLTALFVSEQMDTMLVF